MKKALKVILKIDGKDKTFTNPFVSLATHRKALELDKKFSEENVDKLEAIDLRVPLVVEAFNNQFTPDEFENGVNALSIEDVWYDVIGVGLLNYPTKEELKKLENERGKQVEEILKQAQEAAKE